MRPSSRDAWVYTCNRDERLVGDDRKLGARCDWQWTSDLHIAKVFPSFGRMLMKRALRRWPVHLEAQPSDQSGNVELSFIIGHRGEERLKHLLMTLQSIAAQRDVSVECIVVEQSFSPQVKDDLPLWVRYIHTPLPHANMPYCRAWAFNVGARLARGNALVLHDNDMLVPQDYASQLMARLQEGYEVANLKRFIFYLNESHSAKIFSGEASIADHPPETVVQNLEAGGSIAITRDAYFSIGGFDESFVGWGGEDNEFWERAQTRRVWPYCYLPIIHLWHSAQSGKFHGVNAPGMRRYWQLATVDPKVRIRNLVETPFWKSAETRLR